MMKQLMFLPLIAVLSGPLTVSAADHHHQGASVPHRLELNGGKRWATDDALRKAMTAIRQASVDMFALAHRGQDTPAQYDALSKNIKAQVNYMVSNCKLEPKADAQLHILIGEMLGAVEVMETAGAGQQRSAGLVTVLRALNAYGEHFEHPAWQAIDLHS